MREVTGVLKMLGSGRVTGNQAGKSFVHYSSVEIGNEVLQKMRTAQALGDYISRGLNNSGPITLYIAGKLIIAVKLSDGKIYYWKRGITTVVFAVIAGPVFGSMAAGGSSYWMPAIFGVWLLFGLSLKSELTQIFVHQPRFAALGGIPLKS